MDPMSGVYLKMKEDDSLDGSYIVGTDMKIVQTPTLEIPDGKFTWHSIKKNVSINRQNIVSRLQELEDRGFITSKLELVEMKTGRRTYMRVYEKTITPKRKKR